MTAFLTAGPTAFVAPVATPGRRGSAGDGLRANLRPPRESERQAAAASRTEVPEGLATHAS